MKKRHIAFAAAIFIAMIWFVRSAFHPLENMENAPAGMVEVGSVTTALELFKTEFGSYPAGDNIEIAKALFGGNPKRTMLLDNYEGRFTDSSGALADIWETPLRIEVRADGSARVLSAGRDRVFGNADDVFLR